MTDLDAIRARQAEALCEFDFFGVRGAPWPTPWGVAEDIKGDGHWDNQWHVLTEDGEGVRIATFEFPNHAELFAHAPADIATLLAEVDRLRRVIDRYGSHDDDCDAWTDGGCDCGWDAVSAQIPTADEALDGDAS